jgi:hypothetical protein
MTVPLYLSCVAWLVEEMGFELDDRGDWISRELEREAGDPESPRIRITADHFRQATSLGEFQRIVHAVVAQARGEDA